VSKIITGAKRAITMSYVNELDNAPEHIHIYDDLNVSQPSKQRSVFEYADMEHEQPTGSLVKASTDSSCQTYTYDQLGKVKSNLQQVGLGDYEDGNTTILKRTALGLPLEIQIEVGERKINKTIEYDLRHRVKWTEQGDVKTVFEYDDFGRPRFEKLYLRGELSQQTETQFDDLGFERLRIISLMTGGTITQSIELSMDYDLESRLSSRSKVVNGALQLKETFDYDKMSRMTAYKVDAGYNVEHLACNEVGRGITEQHFEFDDFNNIKQVVTVLDGDEQDIATYHYSDPTRFRPDMITHTLSSVYPAQVNLKYDDDGNLIYIDTDHTPLVMKYSTTGRLTELDGKQYQYDAFERLLVSSPGDTVRYYEQNSVALECCSTGEDVEFVRNGLGSVVAEVTGEQTKVLACDMKKSVIASHVDGVLTHTSYSPYGSAKPDSRTGFNGEVVELSSGVYMLGNGTRVFIPHLALFSSADTKSPFSAGGINPYFYCHGDPMNLSDPSGHISNGASLAMNIIAFLAEAALLSAAVYLSGGALLPAVLAELPTLIGMAGTVFGIAADSVAIKADNEGLDNSSTVKALNIVSTTLGAASLVAGLPGKNTFTNMHASRTKAHHSDKAYKYRNKRIKQTEATSGKVEEVKQYYDRLAEYHSKKATAAQKHLDKHALPRDKKTIVKDMVCTVFAADLKAFDKSFDAMSIYSVSNIMPFGKGVARGIWASGHVVLKLYAYGSLISNAVSDDESNDPDQGRLLPLEAVDLLPEKYPYAEQA
jgi:RHS repeat-associated protein